MDRRRRRRMNGSLRISNHRSGPSFYLESGSTRTRLSNLLKTAGLLSGRRKRSATVQSGQCRLGQGMRVQIEAGQRRGNRIVLRIRQLVDINCKYRDLVTVRLVAGWRARAAIAKGAIIVSGLDCALGHQLLFGIAGTPGQRRGGRRNIVRYPMPPTAAGRRIRIIHGDGEAFGAARRPAPAQRRRNVAAGAAEALEYLLVGKGGTLSEVGAREAHALRIRGAGAEQAQAKRRQDRRSFHGLLPY